jgi:hypothetical protein
MSTEYYAVPKNAVKVSKIKADVKAGVFGDWTLEPMDIGSGYCIMDTKENSICFGNWGNVLTFVVYAGSGQGELILAKLMKHYKFKVKPEEREGEDNDYEFDAQEIEGTYDPVMGIGDGRAHATPVAFTEAFLGTKSGSWSKKHSRKQYKVKAKVSKCR